MSHGAVVTSVPMTAILSFWERLMFLLYDTYVL